MFERGSYLKIRDNSGGKLIKVLKIKNFFGRQKGKSGDTIIAIIQQLRNKRKNKSKVKLKQRIKMFIVRSSGLQYRLDGSTIRFDESSGIVLNRYNKLLGSRLFGPVNKDIRYQKYFRLLILSPGAF